MRTKRTRSLREIVEGLYEERAKKEADRQKQFDDILPTLIIMYSVAVCASRNFTTIRIPLNLDLKEKILYLIREEQKLLSVREIAALIIVRQLVNRINAEVELNVILQITDKELFSKIRWKLNELKEEGKICPYSYKDNLFYGLTKWFSGEKLKQGKQKDHLLTSLEKYREF